MIDWSDIGGILLDLDGTLIRGGDALPGAVEFVRQLQGAGLPFLYFTNNSTQTPDVVATRLSSLGFPAVRDSVYTSGMATAEWLRENMKHPSSIYMIGEAGLRTALQEANLTLVAESEASADAVVVGLDRNVTYRQFARAMQHLTDGAAFVGTNADRALPVIGGFAPGAGALLALLQSATQRSPLIIGKPNAEFVRKACRKLRIAPAQAVVIGDNPETDLAAGIAAGAKTILVETGVRAVTDLQPDWRVSSLVDLLNQRSAVIAESKEQP